MQCLCCEEERRRLSDGDLLRSLLGRGLGERHAKHAVLHDRLDLLGLKPDVSSATRSVVRHKATYLDALGYRDRTGEATEAPLTQNITILVTVGLELGLSGDGQDVVLHVDVDVLLRQARKLEGRGYEVLLLVLVDVNPKCQVSDLIAYS